MASKPSFARLVQRLCSDSQIPRYRRLPSHTARRASIGGRGFHWHTPRRESERPTSLKIKRPPAPSPSATSAAPVQRQSAAATISSPPTPGRRDRPKSGSSLSALDVLGDVPVPSTSVEVCYYDGFKLNSGAEVSGGDGVLLYGGEAFRWRPWVARDGADLRLLNSRGQWDVANEAFEVFDGLWPRPDLLVIGTGREIRPLTAELRKYLSSLGIRADVVDTRNAASQYNLLATERGELEVAAALVPIGWTEGVGAK